MKYIKVYESWVNEAESAKFDVNKPQAYPMLKLTQGELYTGNEENLRKTLASLYSRSIEKKEVSETDPYGVVNVFNIKITGIDDKKSLLYFKFASAKKDVTIQTEIKNYTTLYNGLQREDFGYDIKSDAGREKIKNAYLIYPKDTDKSKVITKSEDGNVIVLTESSIIVFLPPKPYDEEELAIDLDAICIAKKEKKGCIVGQTCSYISFKLGPLGTLSSTNLGDEKFFANKIFKKA